MEDISKVIKNLNLEEAYKWQHDLEHLSKHHSCPKYQAKYKKYLEQINQFIKRQGELNG